MGRPKGLEDDPFMGSMLINEDQPIFRLTENIGVVELTNDPERRKGPFLSQGLRGPCRRGTHMLRKGGGPRLADFVVRW